MTILYFTHKEEAKDRPCISPTVSTRIHKLFRSCLTRLLLTEEQKQKGNKRQCDNMSH